MPTEHTRPITDDKLRELIAGYNNIVYNGAVIYTEPVPSFVSDLALELLAWRCGEREATLI